MRMYEEGDMDACPLFDGNEPEEKAQAFISCRLPQHSAGRSRAYENDAEGLRPDVRTDGGADL